MGTLFRRSAVALGLSGTGFAIVAWWLYRNPGSLVPLTTAMVQPREFGAFIFARYWLAVEVVSLLLFVALVGAYYLNRGEKLRMTNGELPIGQDPQTRRERP